MLRNAAFEKGDNQTRNQPRHDVDLMLTHPVSKRSQIELKSYSMNVLTKSYSPVASTSNWTNQTPNTDTDPAVGTSLAAIFHGRPGSLELASVKTPTPGPGEMLVRVEGCLLGRRTLHAFQNQDRDHSPVILGCETSGHIEAFGPGARCFDWREKPLKIGTRIVWASTTVCGECFCCRRGFTQRCLRSSRYGDYVGMHEELLLGGLSEHCLIASGTSIVSIPETLPLGVASQLCGPTALANAALERCGTTAPKSMLIIGAGLCGLTLAAMAREHGVDEIIVCDMNPQRVEFANNFGASQSGSPLDLSAMVSKATAGYGVDIGYDFSGSPAAPEMLLPQIRMGGSIVFLNTRIAAEYKAIPVNAIVSRHLSLTGVQGYQAKHLANAADFMNSHHKSYPFESTIATWYSLDNAQCAALEALNPVNFRVGIAPRSR